MNSLNRPNVKVLQHYQIFKDRVLGKGTFGCVFLGEDTKHNIPVAIKMIPLKKFKQEPQRIIPSLKNEIKNMQLLHHKNIVQLYNVIKTENNLYIIVEYCNEGSLEQVIKQRNRTEEMCLNIMGQIVDGFKCLHQNSIVHRDLKPENILLHDRTVKIADFGFSKVVEAGMEEPTLLSFVGTPIYMSPQILQKQNYSSKTDIWSIGMIFYELLYSKRAWEGRGYFILLENILNKPLQFPVLPKVHDETKDIITRMLQLKEEDRISWEELFQFFSYDSLRTIYADFIPNPTQLSSNSSNSSSSSSSSQVNLEERQQQHHSQRNMEKLNNLFNANKSRFPQPSSPTSTVSANSERIEIESDGGGGGGSRLPSQTNLNTMDEEEGASDGSGKLREVEEEQMNEQHLAGMLEFVNQNMNYNQQLQLVYQLQLFINRTRGSKLSLAEVKQMIAFYMKQQQQPQPQVTSFNPTVSNQQQQQQQPQLIGMQNVNFTQSIASSPQKQNHHQQQQGSQMQTGVFSRDQAGNDVDREKLSFPQGIGLLGDLERRGDESAAISRITTATNHQGIGMVSMQKQRKQSCNLNLDEID